MFNLLALVQRESTGTVEVEPVLTLLLDDLSHFVLNPDATLVEANLLSVRMRRMNSLVVMYTSM